MADLTHLVKLKLKLDDYEDDLANHYIKSAKESLELSGVKEQEGALYKNAVLTQVLLDYENQDKELNVGALNNALRSMVLKLKTFGGDEE